MEKQRQESHFSQNLAELGCQNRKKQIFSKSGKHAFSLYTRIMVISFSSQLCIFMIFQKGTTGSAPT